MKAKDWIQQLELIPHPEGGYYRELYRHPGTLQHLAGGGTRNLTTSIYFLLEGAQLSHLHQLKSDEIWYYHQGSGAKIHLFDEQGYHTRVLGPRIQDGEALQVLIPAGTIFGAEVIDQDFVLMGCVVTPGFDFKDFRLVEAEELSIRFPKEKEVIDELTIS